MTAPALLCLAALALSLLWPSGRGSGAYRRHEGIELRARGGRLVHARTTSSEREI